MKVKLSQGEINSFSADISKILIDVPLYYLNEIMEGAMEDRIREGEMDHLDISSEEESSSSEEEEEPKTTSDEEETSTDGEDN
tara:strand:+ start:889 stop:1137 length:249 start_codon:yes stop_codon:yes gene_type:complete